MVRLALPKVSVGTLVAVLGIVMSSFVLVVPSLMVCPSRVRRDSKSNGALVALAVKSGVKTWRPEPDRKKAEEVLWVSCWS